MSNNGGNDGAAWLVVAIVIAFIIGLAMRDNGYSYEDDGYDDYDCYTAGAAEWGADC